MNWEYYLPTRVVFGSGELNKLKSIVNEFSPNKVALITGKTAMKKLGITQRIKELLSTEVFVYDKVEKNPSPEDVQKAVDETKDCDLFIGLGGGAVLDLTKLTAYVSGSGISVIEYLEKPQKPKKPLILIPTTSGTGSEVTPFVALYSNQKKLSATPGYADIALVDSDLTLELPLDITAHTAMDALSQAVEAYWSIYSGHGSDIHAEKAIKLVFENLKKTMEEPKRINREKLALASLEAGLAFSQTKTTAPHAVSYPMSIFYGVPHGLACALTLGSFLEYNSRISEEDCLDKRGPEFVKKRIKEICSFIGCENIEDAVEKLKQLMKDCKLPTTLTEAGIPEEGIQKIIENGFTPERVKNNPRNLTQEELEKMLRKII